MDSAQQDGEDLSSEKPEGCIGEIRLTGFSFVDNIYIYIYNFIWVFVHYVCLHLWAVSPPIFSENNR